MIRYKCRRGVAQLAEHRSPKPRAAGSSPVSPAILFYKRPPVQRVVFVMPYKGVLLAAPKGAF